MKFSEIVSLYRDYRGYNPYPCDQKMILQGVLLTTPVAISTYLTDDFIRRVMKIPKISNLEVHEDIFHQIKWSRQSSTRLLFNLTKNKLLFPVVFEECLFRGLFQQTLIPSLQHSRLKLNFKFDDLIKNENPKANCFLLKENIEKIERVFVSSLLFSLYHYSNMVGSRLNKEMLTATFISGLFFGGVAELTGNLWASTFAHLTHNIVYTACGIRYVRTRG